MTTGTSYILTEGDDAEDLAGYSNVVPFVRPAREPMLIGDLISAFILPDLSVRMVGNFDLPRVAVWADREDSRPRR